MLSSSNLSRCMSAVGCLLLLPAFAGAQQPLQFNVPYSCQDGYTRTRAARRRRAYVQQIRTIDNLPVPGSGHYEQVPIYETRTLSCGFASLRATAPVHPEGSVIGSLAGALNGQPDPAAQFSGTTEAPAGPRMGGTYAGGGLKVEFRPTAAVLDCGDAHVMRPYDVQNAVDRVVVTVRNGYVPLTVTLRPDGTLAGSGTVDVTGRLVSGTNDSAVTFTPHTERCSVGPLTVR